MSPSNPARQPRPGLTIETIVAVDPPREFRIHPRDRSIAYTAEAGGSRQLFVMPFRGGAATQVTASEKPISDPQWSPDGRRIAFSSTRGEPNGAVGWPSTSQIWEMRPDGTALRKRTDTASYKGQRRTDSNIASTDRIRATST